MLFQKALGEVISRMYHSDIHDAHVNGFKPFSHYTSYFRGYQLVSNAVGSVLNVTRINRQHMGTYVCQANNGIPPDARKEFNVKVLCK